MPAEYDEYHFTTRSSWRARGPEAEVRAFAPSFGVGEDPVTGGLNAGLAQWLAGIEAGGGVRRQPGDRARTRRPGAHQPEDGLVSVGGDTLTIVRGSVAL